MSPVKLTIIGAGAWGTALAVCASGSQERVLLFDRNVDKANAININHGHESCLHGMKLPENIMAISDLRLLSTSQFIALVIPAQEIRAFLQQITELDFPMPPNFIICCKGIEIATGKLITEIIADIFPNSNCAVLSGPNFALEIAKGKPATATLACKDKQLAQEIKQLFETKNFRITLSQDVIVAQIAGALKNVIAIAAGLADGLQLGENARASLIAQGAEEMMQLCQAMGGNLSELFSPAGIGDLFLTCNSRTSRNTDFGFRLATSNVKLTEGDVLIEGCKTVIAWQQLAEKYKINTPLVEAIYNVIYKGKSPYESISNCMNWELGC
jgi:glycerol-3-phosphate dehydrogenase (NAD(P)+)